MKNALFTSFSLLAGLCFLLTDCSHDNSAAMEGALTTSNDFESVLGWGGSVDASITTERAHSGKYAVKVGPQNEFGYTYIQTLGKMSIAKAKSVSVSAWVWVPSANAPANLVVSVSHSPERDTPVSYNSLNLATKVKKFKEWQQVSQTFILPDSVQATNQLKCYLWKAGSGENVYADDIAISVSN